MGLTDGRLVMALDGEEALEMRSELTLDAAISAHRQGRVSEACEAYLKILAGEPENVVALQWLGTAHAQRGDLVTSMELYNRVIKLKPDYAEAQANRGNVLRLLNRYAEALDGYDEALRLRPGYAEAHCNRGITLRDMLCLEEALMSQERAISIKPDYAQAWKNKGSVLNDLGRFEEALACQNRVITLCPHDAQAFVFRGHSQHRLRRFEEAVESYDRALQLRPNYAEAHYDRSLSLRELLRLEEAIQSCEDAVKVRPDYAEAWWNEAEMRILLGDYERGWPMFEWRWRSAHYGKVMRHFAAPLWLGEECLVGKSILIHLDGGYGDTLNFCRYVCLLVARGARVIFEVQASLVALLQGSFPQVQVIGSGEGLPECDFQCPLMNLPGAFRLPLELIPSRLPYVQVPRPVLARWEARLGPKQRPRIGLAWSGSRDHSNDAQRSMTCLAMAGLLTQEAEFHCLQKYIREEDRAVVGQLPIRVWERELEDFAETAGLVMAMDLIVCVDTSIAHLAGALGKPTWVLLPHVPDMRWLLDRDDSPWYPGVMRLFRQPQGGEWDAVVTTVCAAMDRFLKLRQR